ncbi:MAG: hypothetical protein IKK43_01125 [Clostridia bacterium]|nr:hypothetical protein [Clostridia bacterium]
MKKILLVLSILSLVSFVGCSEKKVEDHVQNNVVENQEQNNVGENQEELNNNENIELPVEELTLNKEKIADLVKSGVKVENETIGNISLSGNKYKLEYGKNSEDTFALIAYTENNEANIELAIWNVDDPIEVTELTIFKDKYLVVAYKNPYNEKQSALQIYDENLNRIELILTGVIFDEQTKEFKYEVQENKILVSEYQFMEPNQENQHNLYRVDYELVEENGKLIRNTINEDKTDTAFTAAT